MRVCEIDGCEAKHFTHGYCVVHYGRERRYGDPLAPPRRVSPVEAFWERVVRAGDDECWQWTGSLDNGGYGTITTRLRPTESGTRLPHRVAYELLVGPIPDGLWIDHLCRNRGCVNPRHLEPVTPRQNTERGLHGVLRTHCKNGHELTPENTWINSKDNSRRCRTCARLKRREQRAKSAGTYAKAGLENARG